MEGRILGGRYELIEKIGGGGMAQVYKAKDQLLNRFVAVKILRQEFNDDEEFVKRFKVEAQSSAGLSHPNIVSIYDVGQDGIIQYIVMELIDGITLKEYIAQNGFLRWEEAVNITIQICSAIEHAHKNHIIHRDIKPQNIMMTDTGVAKVTDFGIARAVSASTITIAGNTIGSVHYFSPEQARGGFVDEKSDLYSIGITLYEMVTGKIPFDGDTPVAVALKHIQDTPVSPMTLNETIPEGVNDIVMKAIKKDQNIRYQQASEMTEDLYLVLKRPAGGFIEDEVDTGFSTKRVKTIDEENLDNIEKPKVPVKKKEKVKYWIVGAVTVILIALISVLTFAVIVPMFSVSDDYVVTSYVGMNINDVKQNLTEEKISYTVKYVFSDKTDKDLVISQNKSVGVTLKRDGYEKIELVVSKGIHLIEMPDFSGQDPRNAIADLKALGVSSNNISEKQVYSSKVAEGVIVNTSPKSESEFKLSDKIVLNVSRGPKDITTEVPNLVGKTYAQAKKLLEAANLVFGSTFPADITDLDYNDKIIEQTPVSGTTVNEKDAVNIFLECKLTTTTWAINLSNNFNFTEPLIITLVITPSDTGSSRTLFTETINKTDFPRYYDIPIPAGGSTLAQVFINNVLYSSITES